MNIKKIIISILTIIVFVILISVIFVSLIKEETPAPTKPIEKPETVQIIVLDVDYKENVSYLTLNAGYMKTTEKIDSIYILVGSEKYNVDYKEEKLKENVYSYTWEDYDNIRKAFYINDTTEEVKMYVKYKGEDINVITDKVNIKGCNGDAYYNFNVDWLEDFQ